MTAAARSSGHRALVAATIVGLGLGAAITVAGARTGVVPESVLPLPTHTTTVTATSTVTSTATIPPSGISAAEDGGGSSGTESATYFVDLQPIGDRLKAQPVVFQGVSHTRALVNLMSGAVRQGQPTIWCPRAPVALSPMSASCANLSNQTRR